MGFLAQTRGVLLEMMLLVDVRWPDGSVHVPAGSLGQAVIRWGGDRPGWFVEFNGHGACGVYADGEGKVWARVAAPTRQTRLQ